MWSITRSLIWPQFRSSLVRNCAKSAADSNSGPVKYKVDYFFKPEVQKELEFLTFTGVDYNKVFRIFRRGQVSNSKASYEFLTTEELENRRKQSYSKIKKRLQMPPVLDERPQIKEVLDEDQAIRGYDATKMIFTDITYGLHNRERTIVVREPDGILREATWEERDRMNYILFPRPGQKPVVPEMFHINNLATIMKPEKYEYILDRCCVQFEPDHPLYIRTVHSVYKDVYKNKNYDALHSTRHYGPMVFHFVWEKNCEDLLIGYLNNLNIAKAISLIRLFGEIHSESAVAKSDKDGVDLIRLFISKDSENAAKLHASLELYLERMEKIISETESSDNEKNTDQN